MKFPITTINKDEYYKKITDLLNDGECQIFIDTNIFALFFRIYFSARKEFFDWLQPLIENQRVKTPIWAVNEYTNRFIRNQIEDYFSPLKKVNTTQKDFNELSAFMKMNIDEVSLKGTDYKNVKEYLQDLNTIEEKLKKIAVTTKSKDEAYKNEIHNEIQKIFEQTIIKSDLPEIFDKIERQGQFRYNHKLPPGFEDDKKDLNGYGDLIIWFEILEHCKKDNVKKAILITNDSKKDWVYSPSKIIENSKIFPNTKSPLKVADTRLVYEFNCNTGSEDFYIISFETLTKLLINNSQVGFIELARALQIATIQETKSELTIEDLIGEDEILGNKLNALQEETFQDKKIVKEKNTSKDDYSSFALADENFPLNDSSFITETIKNLKTNNWYIQNPALEKFNSLPWLGLPETQEYKDKLFVLGRNIYQSACGGANASGDMLLNLRKYFTSFSDFVINHLYSGMLYEIYFNSKNKFREDKFKATYINQVFELQDLSRLQSSIEFIKKKLEPYKSHLLILPNQEPEKIKVLIRFKEQFDSSLNFLGIVNKYLEIYEIKLNDSIISTTSEIDVIEGYYHFGSTLDEIKGMLSVLYLIPRKQMDLDIEPKINEEPIFIFATDLKLKKMSSVIAAENNKK